MIAVQKIGKSFMGAFRYNGKKTLHPDKNKRAVVLDSNFTAIDHWGIQREVDMVRSLRPSLNRYVYHTSLNFHKDDRLDNKTLLAIAHDYLIANGFDDNQYMIYRHHDADHPHLHLLVNRIRYDGSVVSDSNNYRQSEVILRKLEERYNLATVASAHQVTKERRSGKSSELKSYAINDQRNNRTSYPDNYISAESGSNRAKKPYNANTTYQDTDIAWDRNNTTAKRAPTKDELEMMSRTGHVSEKLLLQEKLTMLVPLHNVTIEQFIAACKKEGIDLLFNQALTGRVSGITYFHNGFKIRGQALGNRFKWGEIIKHIDYEQGRDSAAISAANDNTRAKYDQYKSGEGKGAARRDRYRIEGVPANDKGTHGEDSDQSAVTSRAHTAAGSYASNSETKQGLSNSTDLLHRDERYPEYDRLDTPLNIQIADDVDDEAINGMKRRRRDMPRRNRR
ncbi:relaxase/mobilization nuclease domain-containing protein [Mucilaginibacter sp. UR6-1]|uniref:relaxase/mobilization nuclease domain-containing protein n=1 Tax=Mucilaginibacter sp. UR6-1 TaxID=1435643 RepID=UPI001E53FF95|nr:relaxase/mobilization nuclease domain-containing protein [Mucilaginibacter sp. UR6-1]MCC8408622.1 relaxase/mobilization nuclease domain-containing protein [Mucilaginibacter sp. UR6-1]